MIVMSIPKYLKLLAGAAALVLALIGAPAAADTAAPIPATEVSLKRLFEVQKTRKIVDETLTLLEAQHAAQVERDTQPDKLEAARRNHERFAAILRQKLTWDALEPLAVAAHQQHYDETEIQELLAFYDTEAGRLSVDKLQTAQLRAMVAASEVTEQRLSKLLDDVLADRPVKPLPRKKWQPANAHEQLAADLSVVLVKESFMAGLKTLEQRMNVQLSMFLPEEGAFSESLTPKIKRLAAAIQANLDFRDVQPAIVKELAASLSEAELRVLVADARLPERKAQRDKQLRVQDATSAAFNGWMRENLMPELAKVLKEEQAAAAPAPN